MCIVICARHVVTQWSASRPQCRDQSGRVGTCRHSPARGPRGHSATRDGVGTARGTQVHNMLVEKLLEQKRDEIVSKWTL